MGECHYEAQILQANAKKCSFRNLSKEILAVGVTSLGNKLFTSLETFLPATLKAGSRHLPVHKIKWNFKKDELENGGKRGGKDLPQS